MTRRPAGAEHRGERGQGLVEFTLILPLFLLFLLIMVEFGFAFNHDLSVGLASREGARTGASLASGGVSDCSGGNDPSNVDRQIIAAAQRILKSPGSDVIMSDVTQIRIFKADATGAQIGSFVNIWVYTPGTGPDVDPGAGSELLDFSPQSVGWAACTRNNSTPNPDSVGVSVRYTYRLVTPLAPLVGYMRGNQAATWAFNEQTVMSLNPTN